MFASPGRLATPQTGLVVMTSPKPCPVCGAVTSAVYVDRGKIPVYQNVTYATVEAARAAPLGRFVLSTCHTCGFSFNAGFDPDDIVYDENYDNYVASSVFESYYESIAGFLIEKYGLTEGRVFDIGCGKGEFLEVFHRLSPDVEAIGIDPSCTPREQANLRLIRSGFESSHFMEGAKLVSLRHVLEHIGDPVSFLNSLKLAMPDTPLYVEVPDLDWILDNDAFWDFCYEHCNYFTPASLANACILAGFSVEEQSSSFNGQYHWAIVRPSSQAIRPTFESDAWQRVKSYAEREEAKIDSLKALSEQNNGLVVWGMATKGVLLSNILPPGLIRGGVDMNPGKQGRFVAGSALQVQTPDWLETQPAGSLVLVMNPNYAAEVSQTISDLGIQAQVQTP